MLADLCASLPLEEERKKDLDIWDLMLMCDHVAQHIQRREHGRVSARVVGCPECGERRHAEPSCRFFT